MASLDITTVMQRIEEMATFNLERDAYFFAQELEGKEEYQAIRVQALWIAFPLLRDQGVVELFEQHVVASFTVPFLDLWLKLKAKLLGLLMAEDRDVFKKKIKEALQRNKELLTTNAMSGFNGQERGTIGNWLIDYTRVVGNKSANVSLQAEYFIKSANAKNLLPAVREQLTQLIKLYERLKLSSSTPLGYEATIPVIEKGHEGSIREGAYEPRDPRIAKLMQGIIVDSEMSLAGTSFTETASQVINAYQVPLAKEALIQELTSQLTSQLRGNQQSFIEYVAQGLSGSGALRSSEQGVALVRVLVHGDVVPSALRHRTISTLFTAYLTKRGKQAELEGFKVTPHAPLYVALFVRFMLEDQLKLVSPDAAREALHLFTFLAQRHKEYAELPHMIYFDVTTQQFTWK